MQTAIKNTCLKIFIILFFLVFILQDGLHAVRFSISGAGQLNFRDYVSWYGGDTVNKYQVLEEGLLMDMSSYLNSPKFISYSLGFNIAHYNLLNEENSKQLDYGYRLSATLLPFNAFPLGVYARRQEFDYNFHLLSMEYTDTNFGANWSIRDARFPFVEISADRLIRDWSISGEKNKMLQDGISFNINQRSRNSDMQLRYLLVNSDYLSLDQRSEEHILSATNGTVLRKDLRLSLLSNYSKRYSRTENYSFSGEGLSTNLRLNYTPLPDLINNYNYSTSINRSGISSTESHQASTDIYYAVTRNISTYDSIFFSYTNNIANSENYIISSEGANLSFKYAKPTPKVYYLLLYSFSPGFNQVEPGEDGYFLIHSANAGITYSPWSIFYVAGDIVYTTTDDKSSVGNDKDEWKAEVNCEIRPRNFLRIWNQILYSESREYPSTGMLLNKRLNDILYITYSFSRGYVRNSVNFARSYINGSAGEMFGYQVEMGYNIFYNLRYTVLVRQEWIWNNENALDRSIRAEGFLSYAIGRLYFDLTYQYRHGGIESDYGETRLVAQLRRNFALGYGR